MIVGPMIFFMSPLPAACRTHHEEFYQVHADSDQPPALNRQLRRCEHTYNCVHPHQSLAYLTPLGFVTRWKQNLRKAKCH